MSRVIAKHCDGCSIGDPSERHHDCIIRNGSYSEWFEYKFEKMLHKVDFYLVYELLKYFLMDSFSIEEIDKSLPFFFQERYLSDVPYWKRIKLKLISSYMEEGNQWMIIFLRITIITIMKEILCLTISSLIVYILFKL